MRENTDPKNSEYGHFSRSAVFWHIACSGTTKLTELYDSMMENPKIYLDPTQTSKLDIFCENS